MVSGEVTAGALHVLQACLLVDMLRGQSCSPSLASVCCRVDSVDSILTGWRLIAPHSCADFSILTKTMTMSESNWQNYHILHVGSSL